MLNSLAIEPLLNKFRKDLQGLCIPSCANVFKVSPYADYVIVFIKGQRDVDVMIKS